MLIYEGDTILKKMSSVKTFESNVYIFIETRPEI